MCNVESHNANVDILLRPQDGQSARHQQARRHHQAGRGQAGELQQVQLLLNAEMQPLCCIPSSTNGDGDG